MGIMSKLFGSGGKGKALPRQPLGNPVVIPAVQSAKANVVGVTYYQDGFMGSSLGPARFELRAEPNNQHDRNAVTVVLNGRRIGYLSSTMAQSYQPLIAQLQREGPVYTDGEIELFDGGFGARIHLPRDEFLAQWVAASPSHRFQVPIGVEWVNLKRAGDYQDVMSAILGRRDNVVSPGVLVGYETERGKYKGQTALRGFSGQHCVGIMPAQYRKEIPEVFEAVEAQGRADVTLRIARYDSGNLVTRIARPIYAAAAQPPSPPPPPSLPPMPPPPAPPSPT